MQKMSGNFRPEIPGIQAVSRRPERRHAHCTRKDFGKEDAMITATSTEMQNNFGKYLKLVQDGDEVIILKNGKKTARLISYEKSISYLTDSLTGVLKNNCDDKKVWEERTEKYENTD